MLAALQSQIATWLAEDPDLRGPNGIEVFTERKADFLSALELQVKTLTGLALVVAVPTVTRSRTHQSAIDAAVTVHVWENVLLNMSPQGRQTPAADVALCVLGTLEKREPPGGWSPLSLEAIRLGNAGSDGILMYEVVLRTGVILRKA